jgi:beta-glucosidase/6-phospho-beta-glucosidase/beta-galactosidase
MKIGWIANPLFYGEYPSIMKESIAAKSKLQGRSKSRLPTFDSVSSSMIKNSVDFIGLNYYTSELVQPIEKVEEANCSSTNGPGWNNDLGTDRIRDASGKLCGAIWQRDVPTGIRNTLNWIKKEYGNPTVIITENGMSANDESLDDLDRVEFFRGHISETLKAIKEDGCNVKGYLGWCLLDVFEWAEGYT